MYEWDETKNRSNIKKHGLGFATAVRIFEGPVFRLADNRFDYGEQRSNSIGRVGSALVIVVTHTGRDGRTRIIPARPAKRAERNRYEQALHERTGHRRTGDDPG